MFFSELEIKTQNIKHCEFIPIPLRPQLDDSPFCVLLFHHGIASLFLFDTWPSLAAMDR